jgi:hypothetical protein
MLVEDKIPIAAMDGKVIPTDGLSSYRNPTR